MEAVRGLITQNDLTARAGGGVAATVYGDLSEMIALASGGPRKQATPGAWRTGVNCQWFRGQDLALTELRARWTPHRRAKKDD